MINRFARGPISPTCAPRTGVLQAPEATLALRYFAPVPSCPRVRIPPAWPTTSRNPTWGALVASTFPQRSTVSPRREHLPFAETPDVSVGRREYGLGVMWGFDVPHNKAGGRSPHLPQTRKDIPLDTLLISMLSMDDPLRDNTSLGVPLGDGLSGPELAWVMVGMGVFLVLAATTGYVVMSVAFVREHRRRAAADWARAMGEWRRVGEEREHVDKDREAAANLYAAARRANLSAEYAADFKTEAEIREEMHLNSWCPCKVIPQHLVKDHPMDDEPTRCTDPTCPSAESTHSHPLETP